MSATRVSAPRLSPRVVALSREVMLLAFIGAVTFTATRYVIVDWGPAPCDDPVVGLVIAGASMVPALLRHRLPGVAVLTAAALFGWYPAAGIALAVAAYSVAARVRNERWRTTVLVVAALLPVVIGLVGSGYQWKAVLVDFGVSVLVCVAGPVVVQALLVQREQLISALHEQTRYAGSTARLQERTRIAQEMHDLLGHRLSLISLYAGSLELDTTTPRHISDPARLIRGTVRTAMDELRATLGILRQPEPASTQPADHTGTRADVFQLVRQAQAGGVHVRLEWTGDDLTGVASPVRQAVHRIVREGLTNVCRHAQGAHGEVVVEHGSDCVRVGVFDDGGTAAPAPGTGLGLAGVQERVRLLGGSFEAGPRQGRGFRVTATLPLTATSPIPVASDGPARPDDQLARAGMSAVLATGLIGAVAILVVTFNTVMFDFQNVQAQLPFETLALGSTRDQVTDTAGPDSPLARLAARGVEPARPANAQCSYSYYQEGEWTMIERYCFHRDLLVQKTRFELPKS
ncbi:histidine kinase [Lentzea sp. NPDC005914]|uniref:sensor histidine kinase n=1 Tax=Lentzea sp. NPDC005914 TaxID=3154572 RepID=UPI0033E9A03D